MSEIRLCNVSFAYNDDIILRDITMNISLGEFLVIVGPNGAGKSTLLKIIAGILTPFCGQILLNEENIKTWGAKGGIGYVPQTYSKNLAGFPVTVEEIVNLGLIASSEQLTKTAQKHIVNHMLELMGIEALRNCRIGELSGGQQQRVMVARALAGNPKLLLLDEPTSGIDPEASTKIYQLLGELNRNLGITVIMVSHDINKATDWASAVACINHGLCFYGTAEEFRSTHAQALHLLYYAG